ncbi:hypothetical protein [Mangrovimonas sp. ST2L15]|uniref:hypothetical protein n=1 Tax=Mangrovimonas sp. ST2L15 TaxID=1645916 RepID=UPI0006B49B7A|nr:hypothetical protein [Mangrovimonas sp. ST2L15]
MYNKKSDHIFFLSIAIWIFIICILGFTRTLSSDNAPITTLAPFTAIHGIISFGFILIYLVQNILMNTSKYRNWHFKLGWIGLIFLIATFVSGIAVAVLTAQMRGKPLEAIGESSIKFLVALVFGLAGIYYRQKPYIHKRLMLLCAMVLAVAAVTRLVIFGFVAAGTILSYLLFFLGPLIALIIYDAFTYRKIFRVSIFGFVFIFLGIFMSDFLWQTKTWEKMVNLVTPIENVKIDNIGLVGTASPGGWEKSISFEASALNDNQWVLEEVKLEDGSVKFIMDNRYDYIWGGDGTSNGKLVRNGEDIYVIAGLYQVILDFESKTYVFLERS